MANGLAMLHMPSLPGSDDPELAALEELCQHRFTDRSPDYAQVGEKVFERPVIQPWPPSHHGQRRPGGLSNGRHNGVQQNDWSSRDWHQRRTENRSRHDDWQQRDHGHDNRSASGNNYKGRYGHHRREPYRDLDEQKTEHKTKYQQERDEADDVADFLDNYRRNFLDKDEPSSKSVDSPVKDVVCSDPPTTSSPSKRGQNGLASIPAASGDGATADSESPMWSRAALDRYRVKPKTGPGAAAGAMGFTHKPLPYQLASIQQQQQQKKRPAPRGGVGTAGEKGAQKKVSAAAVARSQKTIKDAVKAASGKTKAGSGSASLAKYISSGLSPQKKPQSASTSSPVKGDIQSPLARSPLSSPIKNRSRRSSIESSPEGRSQQQQQQSPANGTITSPPQLTSQVLLNDSKIVLRLAPTGSPAKPTIEEEPAEPSPVEPPLKLTLRLPPPPAELGSASTEKAKKHKKHKKHKRTHHDSPEKEEPVAKKVRSR